MEDTRERWLQLAEQAARELDSQKLLELVEEINQLLEASAVQRPKQPARMMTE
jgi:hypothetical protein